MNKLNLTIAILSIVAAFTASAADVAEFHTGDHIHGILLSKLTAEAAQKDSPALFELIGSHCRLLTVQTTSNNKPWFFPNRLVCKNIDMDVSNSIAMVRLDYRTPDDFAATTAEFEVTKDIVFQDDSKGVENDKIMASAANAPLPQVGEPCWGSGKDGRVGEGATGPVVCRSVNGHTQFRPATEAVVIDCRNISEAIQKYDVMKAVSNTEKKPVIDVRITAPGLAVVRYGTEKVSKAVAVTFLHDCSTLDTPEKITANPTGFRVVGYSQIK